MKITEQKVIEYVRLLRKNMKTKRINIPVGIGIYSYTKNSIMDIVVCLEGKKIEKKLRDQLIFKPDTQQNSEHELLEPIAINHIELEVSYMTKKAVFGAVPDADEMRVLNSYLKGMRIESDRALLRSLKD